MTESKQRRVVTGASASYGPSVLALAGSLNLNWPGHPPLLVYDIGMRETELKALAAANIEVRKVPEFVPHWRSHWAWKVWAWHDAPCDQMFWIDAGICVLRPMPEVLAVSDALGYFASANHFALDPTLSDFTRTAMGLTEAQTATMASINSGAFVLNKDATGIQFCEDALRVASDEEAIKAREPLHRPDQSLASGLLYKYYGEVLFADFAIYAGWQSPNDAPNQKLWVHRRRMQPQDVEHFSQHMTGPAKAYMPSGFAPVEMPSRITQLRTKLAILRGKLPSPKAVSVAIPDGVKD